MIVSCGLLDGTVKIWNASDGSMIASLKGGSGNSIVSCDVENGRAAGGGNDKTCRVWDIQTQRMLHQLVGHTNIITCVRFVSGGRGVVTASKDRQIKVWDISKQTYRESTNIVLTSSANSIDISENSYTMVSGHTDGGLRFWDIRTGQRNAEIKSMLFYLILVKNFYIYNLTPAQPILSLFSSSALICVDHCESYPQICRYVCEISPIRLFQGSYEWNGFENQNH